MFERPGAPLFVHIAAGVTFGIVAGGVSLYMLWMVKVRVELAEFNRSISGAARSHQAAPRPVLPPKPCEAGATLGRVNDQLVCVSASGQVTPAR